MMAMHEHWILFNCCKLEDEIEKEKKKGLKRFTNK
jgi:hypothetical protein